MASIISLKNDTYCRYIQISAKSKDSNIPITISSVYLEPDANIINIPEDIFDSDIIAGDLNNAETGLQKDGIYHFKGIENIRTIQINKKISDHDIKIGEVNVALKLNERFVKLEINDKIKILENEESLMNIRNKTPILINPKKIIIRDNYELAPSDLNKYDDFINLKELYKKEYKDKYATIEKLIRGGNITKNGWYKINKLFNEKRKKELCDRDCQFTEIINFYKELYQNNYKRNSLNHNQLKQEIYNIIDIIIRNTNENENRIWPPKTEARDYNGFSQRTIENIIKDKNLINQLNNFKKLLGILCNSNTNSELFLHTISKAILFKKQTEIRGGTDIE